MNKTNIVRFTLALGLCTAFVACDGGKKDAAPAGAKAADAKADDAKADDAKADDAKADDAKADDAKGDAAAADGDGPLVGTWALDPEGFKEMDEYKNAPDDQKKMMEAMLGSMKMEMTFTADTMKMNVEMGEKKESREGTYKVKSNEGGKVTIETDVDGKKEEITVSVDGGKLTMSQGKQTMVFKKAG